MIKFSFSLVLFCFLMRILQWNAKSIVRQGAEFKAAVTKDLNPIPDIICIQESWLKDKNYFNFYDYETIRKDRKSDSKSRGGGCMTLIKKGLSYKVIELPKSEIEILAIDVYINKTNWISVINIYNPCLKLNENFLDHVFSVVGRSVIMCGDFNGHNILWGSLKNDSNGLIIEKAMENGNLVCLNTGTGTRLDEHSGNTSCLDLTWTSNNIAAKCVWEVLDNNWGSDHFPILIDCGVQFPQANPPFTPKWSIKRADWGIFHEECKTNILHPELDQSIDTIYEIFIDQLSIALNNSIPKTKPPLKNKHPVIWWNVECEQAVKEKRLALKTVRRTRLPKDYIEYKKKRAICRRIINQTKRISWQDYCTAINPQTSTKCIWDRVKSISHSRSFKSIPCLITDTGIAVSNEEKANMLVDTFSNTSSTKNYDEVFQEIKRKAEKDFIISDVGNDTPINDYFTVTELDDAISNAKCTTPGADGIGASILKELPNTTCQILLVILNEIWKRGECPSQWKEAILTPIFKPGKDPSKPISYRPIALTATLCKVMERMITSRLDWFLEINGFINDNQSGFRKSRRTIDHLAYLESSIQMGFANRESTLTVFLDLEKAYDMVWRKGVLIKLQQFGLGGRIIRWIKDFLSDRTIRVKVDGVLSNTKIVENGVPQGSVISPILFNVSVHDLYKHICHTKICQFADDIAIWKTHRNINLLNKHLQIDLDHIFNWCRQWGFKLSATKSVAVMFSLKSQLKNMSLRISEKDIVIKKSAKFLGLIYDSRLTWSAHIEYIVNRCKTKINLLRCIAGCKWGANCSSLLNIYRALIRPVLEYGCEAFDSASDTVKNRLNGIQYKALKICTGALCQTSLTKLQVECGEPPLQLTREYLCNIFSEFIRSKEDHPCHILLEDCWQKHYFEEKWIKKGRIPFGCRGSVSDFDLMDRVRSVFPYWYYLKTDVHFSIQSLTVGLQNKCINRNLAIQNINEKWFSCLHMYTDGSVDPIHGKVGCGFYVPLYKYTRGYKLQAQTSIFSAELVAIYMALVWISEVEPTAVCIFSDSISALQAISHNQSNNPIICDIKHILCSIFYQGIEVHFDWVPSHCGVAGNEGADSIAKQAANKSSIDLHIKLNISEIKHVAKLKLKEKWQQYWAKYKQNTLKDIEPNVKFTQNRWGGNRKSEVIFHRLRMGSGRSLKSYLYMIKKHPNGICEECLKPDTVGHFLLECYKYRAQRIKLQTKLKLIGINKCNLRSLLGGKAPFKEVIEFIDECKIEL